MHDMFFGAYAFSGDISAWNTSSVTDMSSMFSQAYYFNGDLSAWDVSSVTDMNSMFYGASSDQNLGPWYVTLNSTRIGLDDTYHARITPQNPFLSGQGPAYSLAAGAGCADNGKFSISGNGILSLKSASPQDAYSICIAASGGSLFGTSNVRQISLSANSAPIANAGTDRIVDEGTTVNLDASASSDPDNDIISYNWTASPAVELQGAATAYPSFTAPHVSSDTDYVLTLTVSDDSASSTDTVVITARDVPPLPTPPSTLNLDVASSTTDSVALIWDDPGDGSITGYKILSRVLDPKHRLGVLVADTGSANNTYTVSGLEPGTKYTFRIIALGEHGESKVSYFANARTERVPPPAAPTNLGAASVTADSVTLTWDDPGDDSITGYKILSRILDPQHRLDVLVADTGTSNNTYTVSGLEPGTNYAFRVIAISDHGESELSYFANARTLPGS